jgi:hypothetical protein
MDYTQLAKEYSRITDQYRTALDESEVLNELTVLLRNRIEEKSVMRELFWVDKLKPGEDAYYPIRDETEAPVWVLPGMGYPGQDYVELLSEEIHIPTFIVQAAKDWLLKYTRENKVDVIGLAVESVSTALANYEEEAGWRVVVPASTTDFDGAGVLPPRKAPIVRMEPANTACRYFSKEIVNRLVLAAQRNNKVLESIWVSPEDMADIREYVDVGEIDQGILRADLVGKGKMWELEIRSTGSLGVFGAYNINAKAPKDDKQTYSSGGAFCFTEDGKFNDYRVINPNTPDKNGELQRPGETQIYAFTQDVKKSLVMPIKQEYSGHWDPTLLRRQKAGFFGWQEFGVACLSPKCIYMGIIDRRFGDVYDFRVE